MYDYIRSIALNPIYTANMSLTVLYNFTNILTKCVHIVSNNFIEKYDNIDLILPDTIEYELARLDILNTINSTKEIVKFLNENYICNKLIKLRLEAINELLNNMSMLYESIIIRINQHKNKYF